MCMLITAQTSLIREIDELVRVRCQIGEYDIQLTVKLWQAKVDQIYSGTSDTERYDDMIACDQEGRLMVHTTKQYPTEDTTCFHVLGRVMSGTLHAGQEVTY